MPRMLRRASVLGTTAHIASKRGQAQAEAAAQQQAPTAPPPPMEAAPPVAAPAEDTYADRRRLRPDRARVARPLRDAIVRAGGVPVSGEWIHPLDLVEVGLLAAEDLEPVWPALVPEAWPGDPVPHLA